MKNKIIRTIALFSAVPTESEIVRLKQLRKRAESAGFEVQTIRLISQNLGFKEFERKIKDPEILLGLGTIDYQKALTSIEEFYRSERIDFNINSTNPQLLFELMKHQPAKTFHFTYVFENPDSSPYFPSANYAQDGFSVGLQSTDLSEDCKNLDEYLEKLKAVYQELMNLFDAETDFLGIDSSIAPLFEGKSSFVNLVKRLSGDFKAAATTDFFVRITNFIKNDNPKPIGLCGLMLPALEDFELAAEYEKGEFSIERNIFLSLHSGLGIDTYPIGIDEKPERVEQVLKLLEALAEKHNKPLSARFVSDGKARIGQKTDFKNQYLKDVVVRSL